VVAGPIAYYQLSDPVMFLLRLKHLPIKQKVLVVMQAGADNVRRLRLSKKEFYKNMRL